MYSDKIHLDLVVPSVRVDIEKLRSIASLKVPNDIVVHFYFVIDNPEASDMFVETHFRDKAVTIIKNDTNRGGTSF